METGSKTANLEFQLSGFNGVELIENCNILEKYQQIEAARSFSKGIVEVGSPSGRHPPLKNQPFSNHKLLGSDHNYEVLESHSQNNGPNLAPSGTLPADPTLIEASVMQKTSEDAKVEHGTPKARYDQPQMDQMSVNPDTFLRRCVSHDNPNPLHDQVELVSSPAGSTNESLPQHGSSKQNFMQPSYSGFKDNDYSVGDATAAQQTASSSPFSPLIMEPTQSFSLALAEKMPQNESYGAQSFYSKDEVNSVQANQLNKQAGSNLQAELLQPQPVEPDNRGKRKMVADEFEDNNRINYFNDNHRAPSYPNLFSQSPSGIRFLNEGSSQINQLQSPTWFSNKENDFYRPLAPGSEVNQFNSTNVSDPQCYNFILPGSSTPSRSQQLNTPIQLLNNQVANMPNASGSLFQHSELTKHSVPMQLMPQHFPYQHNQFPITHGAYSSLARSNMFHESSMPLSSHQLPAHLQASNQFSMMPFLPNPEHQNSELPQASFLSGLQTVQQQGLLNQTAKPIATYPSSGNSLSSLVLNSFLQQETGGSSAPHHMETSLSSNKEEGNSGRRSHARGFEVGESSSFKRFRRESTLPQASSAEQVNNTSLSLLNEASSSSNSANPFYPRQIRNSVYDPMFEGIGLPIDPHLRMFANRRG